MVNQELMMTQNSGELTMEGPLILIGLKIEVLIPTKFQQDILLFQALNNIQLIRMTIVNIIGSPYNNNQYYRESVLIHISQYYRESVNIDSIGIK